MKFPKILKDVECEKCPVEKFCPNANRHNRTQRCKLRKLVED